MNKKTKAPLIGITAGNDPKMPEHYVLRWDYIQGVRAAGGVPVILAPMTGVEQVDMLERLDAVVFTGGLDISPDIYGEKTHPKTQALSRERDEFEMQLVSAALEMDMPVLGICRGMQIMNLAMGGKLLQDIAEQTGSDILHDDPQRPRHVLAHEVSIKKNTRLFHITGAEQILVNSFHHQAVYRMGQGVLVTAKSDDDVIEGIEIPDRSFAVGVQWHPESLWKNDPGSLNFFQTLVEQARISTH